MSNLNWCTYCDKAVSPFSESLYCSEDCLRADALRNHPLLGYTYPEFTDFPHPKSTSSSYNYCQPLSKFPTTATTTTKTTKASHQHLYMFSPVSTSPPTTITSSSSSSSSCNSIIPLNRTTENHAFI